VIVNNEYLQKRISEALSQIMVTGLRIELVAATAGVATIQLSLVDQSGNPIMGVGSCTLKDGESLTATGIERALNVDFQCG